MLVDFIGNHVPRAAASLFPDLLWRRPDGGRTLYLTFDDGPDPASTDATLRLLDRYDVHATFFTIGERARAHPDLVRAVRAEGHAVGQHSDSHPDAWTLTDDALVGEMVRATATLEEILEEPVRWMRPPYGRFTRAMRDWCHDHGQRIVMWDVMPGDFLSQTTSEQIEERVLRLVRPGSILVLHEGNHARTVTPTALERLLPRLLDGGYRFGAL